MKENERGLILQMAQRFIDEMSELEPGFDRAFYRFYVEDRMYESSSSYTKSDIAFVVDTLERNDFFDDMDEISLALFKETKRVPAILLLTIDKALDYEIQFEYKNMKRWSLSLFDGGSGVPSD
jgi:hypothetical protein